MTPEPCYPCKGCAILIEKGEIDSDSPIYWAEFDLRECGTDVDEDWWLDEIENLEFEAELLLGFILEIPLPPPLPDKRVAGIYCEHCYHDHFCLLDLPYKPARGDCGDWPAARYACDGSGCEVGEGSLIYTMERLTIKGDLLLCQNCLQKL